MGKKLIYFKRCKMCNEKICNEGRVNFKMKFCKKCRPKSYKERFKINRLVL